MLVSSSFESTRNNFPLSFELCQISDFHLDDQTICFLHFPSQPLFSSWRGFYFMRSQRDSHFLPRFRMPVQQFMTPSLGYLWLLLDSEAVLWLSCLMTANWIALVAGFRTGDKEKMVARCPFGIKQKSANSKCLCIPRNIEILLKSRFADDSDCSNLCESTTFESGVTICTNQGIVFLSLQIGIYPSSSKC
jgi:hypothetical protein